MTTAPLLALLLATAAAAAATAAPYAVPQLEFLFFHDRGFKASVQAPSPLASQFTISGAFDGGDSFEGTGERVGDRLIYRNDETRVREGDTLRYWVLVRYEDFGYASANLTERITRLVSSDARFPEANVDLEQTEVCREFAKTQYSGENGEGTAPCVGQVVFEDQFNAKSLDEQNWEAEETLPSYEEAEFVSYQKTAVAVDDGRLIISLTQLGDDKHLRSGSLKLKRCSGSRCETSASAAGDILPPYVSGKITTKKSFNFKYGKVEIKAKLPAGNWIYPQLYLRPQTTRGDGHYDWGEMRIATARGNRDLKDGSHDYGNSALYGGVVLGVADDCPRSGLAAFETTVDWADAFHTYGLEWSPDEIKVSADGQVYGTTNRNNKYDKSCRGKWGDATMKPFDEKFYLSIGLAVGGLTEFPDGVGGKPWSDVEDTKPMMKFWNDRSAWLGTWGNQSRLLIDYVKVTAK